MSQTMTTLTRCPLCGADSGYTLHEGSSSKWLAIHCPACGERVSGCRRGYVDPPEGRTSDADEAWNEAGKYAQGLVDRIAQLEATGAPWISTAERMPEDGQSIAFVARAHYRLAHLDGMVFGGRYRASDFTGGFSLPGMELDAWFWMPLPPAPKLASDQSPTPKNACRKDAESC